MWVSATLCERDGTNGEVADVTLLVAMGLGGITRMAITAVALSINGLV
jgi:hypothetical protein